MKTPHPISAVPASRFKFSWACAALLAISLPAAPLVRAATEAANVTALRSNLPANLTLRQASIAQMVKALHEAVLQHHDDALDLLRIAVLAKTPKRGDGELSCEDLRRLVQAACTAASDKTSQLVDLASSLHPDCADDLQNLLAGGGALGAGADGAGTGAEGGDIGAGFGPGFPGSPGFVGSAPSGAFALPPTALPTPSPTPVTATAND